MINTIKVTKTSSGKSVGKEIVKLPTWVILGRWVSLGWLLFLVYDFIARKLEILEVYGQEILTQTLLSETTIMFVIGLVFPIIFLVVSNHYFPPIEVSSAANKQELHVDPWKYVRWTKY